MRAFDRAPSRLEAYPRHRPSRGSGRVRRPPRGAPNAHATHDPQPPVPPSAPSPPAPCSSGAAHGIQPGAERPAAAVGPTPTATSLATAGYAFTPADLRMRVGPHPPRHDRPVRHRVQRRGRRRGIERDGLAQERGHRPDAGVDEQAGHGIQRLDPLRARTSGARPGCAPARRSTRWSSSGLGRPEPHQREPRRDGGDDRRLAARRRKVTSGAGLRRRRRLPRRRRWPTAGRRATSPTRSPPVRGLVRDQRNNSDTAADAGALLPRPAQGARHPAALLRGRANAASTATVIASTKGATLSSMVTRMLLEQRQRDRRGPAQAGRHRPGLRRDVERRPHRAGQGARGAEARQPAPSTTGRACPAPTGSAPSSSPGSSTAASTPAPRPSCGR